MQHYFTGALSAAVVFCAAPAFAASQTTWVSGSGSDAGLCPITAPCKTFQYAHGQTTNNGVITVAAPGNFGPVTITKSISIVADGVLGAIYGGATAGVIINTPGINVSLRGLTIDLFGVGNKDGIIVNAVGELHVHNCVIRSTSTGIEMSLNGGVSKLFVSDTTITDTNSDGISVTTAGGANARVSIKRAKVESAGGSGMNFIALAGPLRVTVSDSVVTDSTLAGIVAITNSGSPNNVMIDRTVVANNSQSGVAATGATIRIGESTVTGNANGLTTSSGGTIASYGTNKVNGNGTDGTPAAVAYK